MRGMKKVRYGEKELVIVLHKVRTEPLFAALLSRVL